MTSYQRRFYIIQIMLGAELEQESYFWEYTACIFILLALYSFYRKVVSKWRLNAVKNRLPHQTKSSQVVVAWEIDNLLVDISDRKRPGYSRVQLEAKNFQFAFEKLKEMFGMGVFYKAKTSVKNMKAVLQSLSDNPKVKLFLYTTLNLEVAQKILERLCLLNFFQPQNRRSCSDGYSEPMKHPTQVDCDTKRVIIVTGSRCDHEDEDSKYFLVLKRKEISESVKYLNKVISKNSDIDELHNELGELKPHLESDYENLE